MNVTNSFWGSSRDVEIPRSGCGPGGRGDTPGFPLEAVEAYVEATTLADGDFVGTYEGTRRSGFARAVTSSVNRLRFKPIEKPYWPDAGLRPYETWSYLSPMNHEVYGIIESRFEAALAALVAYYATIGIAADVAERGAVAGLVIAPFGAACGEAPPPRTLRTFLLDDAPLSEIAAFVARGEHLDAARMEPFWNCRRTAGIDPLAHVAVMRPDALDLVKSIVDSTPPDRIAELDLRLRGHGVRNRFGKTPLMTAAQFDKPESIRWLLHHGAEAAPGRSCSLLRFRWVDGCAARIGCLRSCSCCRRAAS